MRSPLLLFVIATLLGCQFEGVSATDVSDGGGRGPGDVENVLGSCLEYRDAGFALSGVYPLETGQLDYQAYCDMTSSGGGWTLALKIDGGETTFRYDANQPGGFGDIWTSGASFNSDAPDLDKQEAKLLSFAAVAFDAITIRFESTAGVQTDILVTAAETVSSLRALFTAPQPPALTTSAGDWRAMVDEELVILQDNCARLGVNQENGGFHRLRFGIEFNNEDNCDTNDSGVGLGFGSSQLESPAAGAENAVDRTGEAMFATVLVR